MDVILLFLIRNIFPRVSTVDNCGLMWGECFSKQFAKEEAKLLRFCTMSANLLATRQTYVFTRIFSSYFPFCFCFCQNITDYMSDRSLG